MVYITGDTHRDFNRILDFSLRMQTTKDDILIILGDVGINYYGDSSDKRLKKLLSEQIDLTLFCIHGNHEMRPEKISTYKTKKWHAGDVFYEEEYPNIIFAKDGEIYDFEGKKAIVIGGAYSVDKFYRLQKGWNWWDDEQPSEEVKKYVEQQICNPIDIVLTHTTPSKYVPVEMFLSCVDQATVDTSTEEWLDSIEEQIDYKKWYAGHYHTDKVVTEKFSILFNSIEELTC